MLYAFEKLYTHQYKLTHFGRFLVEGSGSGAHTQRNVCYSSSFEINVMNYMIWYWVLIWYHLLFGRVSYRYNNYDRAVINTIPHDIVKRWYVAHRELTTELRKPENELWIKLKPGKVRKNSCLFIDRDKGFSTTWSVELDIDIGGASHT